MSAVTTKLDLTPPPVLKTIAQRLLIAGAAFAVISLGLAFWRPDEFYSAYLLGFMDWLGVALGSMAIFMIPSLYLMIFGPVIAELVKPK